MSEPTPMNDRPPISQIAFTSPGGNPCTFGVGRGVTEIRETEEAAEYANVPWVEVWQGDQLLARFNQHKLDHIFYGVKSCAALAKEKPQGE